MHSTLIAAWSAQRARFCRRNGCVRALGWDQVIPIVPRIPFIRIASAEPPQPPRLISYHPVLPLDGLQLGIDNQRHDVWLSPSAAAAVGRHIANLIAQYGN